MAEPAERMRAVVQHGPKDLRVEDQPVPEPGPGEVLVRVLATGICGSDLQFWRDATYGKGVVLGHEIAGEIAALGSDVRGPSPGDVGAVHSGISCGRCERCRSGLSYYCQDGHGLGSGPYGGYGEYLLAPVDNFLPTPGISDPGAIAFAEPLANGLRALDFAEARDPRTAVVIGCGPIGLSCLIGARRAGAERVWVIESRPRRREAALALGAERVLHPTDDDVYRELRAAFPFGADLSIEAVGKTGTIQDSFRFARPGGAVVLMGVCLQDVPVRPIGWMLKELTIHSSIGCSADDQRSALDLVSTGAVDPLPLVTRRIGIEDIPKALPEIAAGADEIKVVVEHGRS